MHWPLAGCQAWLGWTWSRDREIDRRGEGHCYRLALLHTRLKPWQLPHGPYYRRIAVRAQSLDNRYVLHLSVSSYYKRYEYAALHLLAQRIGWVNYALLNSFYYPCYAIVAGQMRHLLDVSIYLGWRRSSLRCYWSNNEKSRTAWQR